MEPVPAVDLAHPRALQHRRRLHRRAPRDAGRGARGGDRRRRRARRPHASPIAELAERTSRFAAALRGARRRAGRSRADPPAELPRVPDGVPRRDEARRDPRADLDAAHRRGGRLPRARLRRRRDGDRPRDVDALHAMLERQAALRARAARRRAATRAATRLARARPRRARSRRSPTLAPPHPTRADDPAYLVYTSGTTGYPKGVLHAHRALLGRQPSSEYWFDFDPRGDRVLHAGKFNWTYVLGTGLMDPLYRGHTVDRARGRERRAPPGRASSRGTARPIFIAVPTIYRQILQKTPTPARRRADAAPLHERGRAAPAPRCSRSGARASASTSTRRSA